MNAWLIIALLAGTVATFGGAIWLGRHLQKGAQAKSAAEAQEKCPKLSLVIVAPLLNACVVESFSAVSGAASLGSAYFDYKTAKNSEPVLIKPPLATYDLDFMEQAADELELMRPPCARDVVTLNCSTITRMVLDYGELREKLNLLIKINPF